MRQDRGAPITAHGFLDLLAELGVDPSHCRPQASDDNASSQAQVETLKYQAEFPRPASVTWSTHAPGVPGSSTGATIITSTQTWRCSRRRMYFTVASKSSSPRVKRG